MWGQYVCFNGAIRKIILNYPSYPYLSGPLTNTDCSYQSFGVFIPVFLYSIQFLSAFEERSSYGQFSCSVSMVTITGKPYMTPVSFVKTTESFETSLVTINRQTSYDSGILIYIFACFFLSQYIF